MAPAPAARGAAPALLALAAATGACFSDRGVAIEVEVGATGATSVELFLGKTACDRNDTTAGIACTTIAPPDGTVPLDGDIWFRDAPEPYLAQVSAGRATFALRATEPTTLPVVIAVGSAPDAAGPGTHPVATATLRDLAVPVSSARVVMTALTAASPVVLPEGDTHNLTEDRVRVWRKQSPASACVVVEHWDHGAHQRDFIVPEDDPDCDDVPAPECNPAAWHGALTVGGSAFRADCFVHTLAACEVGALGCSDDAPGTGTACLAEREQVCVPESFCGPTCGRFDAPCLRMLATSNTIPRIDCNVPTVSLGLCPGDRIAPVDLDAKYIGSECDQQPLISSLDLSGFDTSATFNGAVFELTSPQKACHFQLQWKSGLRAVADGNDYGLIKVSTANGALLIPLALHFVTGVCGTGVFRCTVTNPGDSLWTCAP